MTVTEHNVGRELVTGGTENPANIPTQQFNSWKTPHFFCYFVVCFKHHRSFL